MSSVRIGIVGCGRIAWMHVEGYRPESDGTRGRGVCSGGPEDDAGSRFLDATGVKE